MADFNGVETVLNTFKTAVENASNGNVLEGYGYELLVSIMSMLLIFQTLRTLLEGTSIRQLMAQFLYLMMLGSFASLLISDSVGAKQKLIASADAIASKVAPGTGGTGFESAYSAVFVMFDAAQKIWESEAPKPKPGSADGSSGSGNNTVDANGNVTGTPASTTTSQPANGGTSVGSALSNMAAFLTGGLGFMILSWLMKIAAIIILVIAGIVALCQFLVSQVLIHIAIILAPIFIPFLVWEQASFMFDGWLKFFVKSCFHKVVGLVIVTLLQTTISQSVDQVQAAAVDGFAEGQALRLTALIGVLLIGCIIAYLMWQIGGIADGLISGSARGGYRFSAPRMPTKTPKPSQNNGGGTPTPRPNPGQGNPGGSVPSYAPQGAGVTTAFNPKAPTPTGSGSASAFRPRS